MSVFEIPDVLAKLGVEAVNPGTVSKATGGHAAPDAPRCAAINPTTGQPTAEIAASTAEDYEAVVQSAVETFRSWRMVPAPRRGELVNRIGQLMAENHDALGAIVSIDTGKSIMEGKGEVKEAIDMAVLAAGQSRMLYGFTQQSQRARHRMYDQWLPLGVAGIITAYNFPAAVWAQNGFLSAIGGNTVIWKPSPKVPLTAVALQHLANRAMKELKCEGVFSLFTPADNRIAELMLDDPRIALVSFTGSTGVGHKVAAKVAANLGRRHLLECSGNNGCVVDETADLAMAAKAITFGVVGTTGQRCTSTRRVIVAKPVAARLTELLKQAFAQVKVGDPRDRDTLVGPLIDQAAVGHFEEAVRSATTMGGKVVFGGKRIDRPGYFVEPTIITGVKGDWPCAQHETFAPILYIIEYDTLDEAIDIHNNVAQGLAGGMHSSNVSNIERFLSAEGSDCGITRINMGTTGADVGAAFGGEKETGGGRTAGSDAWKGYMRRQSVCVNWGSETAWDSVIELG